MNRLLSLFLSLILLGSAMAEPAADAENPLKYAKDGVQFSYPGNWKVSEDQAGPEARYIFVESDEGAILTILLFSLDEAPGLVPFAEKYTKIVEEGTPVGTLESQDPVAIEDDSGKRLRQFLKLTLMGREDPLVREYFTPELHPKVVVISQISVEDRAQALPGFRLIEKSLSL